MTLCSVASGGSRIFPRGGANSQNCYYFSHFCRKLHENERIWTPRGARVPGAPPWIRQWLRHTLQLQSLVLSPKCINGSAKSSCVCVLRPLSVFCIMHNVRCKYNVRRPFCIVLGANTMLGAMENVRCNVQFINILSLNTIFVILQVR